MSVFTARHHGGEGPPVVCVHGFTDTWRTWELVLPALERRHEVLAPTLPGHAGGPPLEGVPAITLMADAVEREMDEAGMATAHLVGNSLGGHVVLQLAARGRARSVVALAPAGGWPVTGGFTDELWAYFETMRPRLLAAAPHADAIVATPAGRRAATEYTTVRWEHLPAGLLADQIAGAAACDADTLLAVARSADWSLDPESITCPVRVVWGAADRILPWPLAATRYRDAGLPAAEWVVLDDVGHCPQLDVPVEVADLVLGVTGG